MSLREVVKNITEAPRRIKERGEEIGQGISKTYHEKREMAAEQSARDTYNERYKENREKLAKGDIDRETYERRQKGYSESMKEESKPIEQRIVKGAKEAAGSISKGSQAVIKEATYSGDKRTYRDMGPVQFGNAARYKGKKGTSAPKSKGMDFSRSTIDFSRGTAVTGLGLNNPLFGGALGFNKKRR
ncbi:MAG: hypothetical protein PHC39_04515 [Proteiniphilum sp.]|nr:hypothetical protein [Proteiniphilum sp.]